MDGNSDFFDISRLAVRVPPLWAHRLLLRALSHQNSMAYEAACVLPMRPPAAQ